MAKSKAKKIELVAEYADMLSKATNVVVMDQSWLGVNVVNQLRRSLKKVGGSILFAKKKLFLKGAEDTKLEKIQLSDLPWSLMLIIANDWDQAFAPLKQINQSIKEYKKEQLPYKLSFLWWWMDDKWNDSNQITELANLPTREELIAKLLYLMKYPIGSFARVVNEVAKTKES